MYQAIYRAYRPEIFGEILGQKHIVKILQNQIMENQVNHAYLFCGTRGTGKTTTARLLAKGVNCLSEEMRPCGTCSTCKSIKDGTFVDLIEIDAASNNGVDNIRELRESVNYPPAVGKKKVYIIDEVHMLSGGAFNALLKTLEEPPSHVMFILATTEPEKLPATILSRCMRMDFKRVPEKELMESMRTICKEKEIEVDEDALRLIVANADGSVRDGFTILDQCISGREGCVTREDILESLGAVGEDVYLELTNSVLTNDPTEGLLLIEKLISDGKDGRQILQGWMNHYRNLLMIKFIENPEDILNMSIENIKRLRTQSNNIELEDINKAILEISKTVVESKNTTQPRILLEVCMVKLATDSIYNSKYREKSFVINNEKRKENIKEPVKEIQDNKIIEEAKNKPEEETLEEANLLGQIREDNIIKEKKESSKKPLEENAEGLDGFWREFIKEGNNHFGGMFSMVRNNAKPIGISEKEFRISAEGMTKKFLEKNISQFEDILEKIVGQRVLIVITKEGKQSKDSEEDNLAAKIEDALGMSIEIK